MHAHREGAAGLAHPLAPAVVAPVLMIALVSMFRMPRFHFRARSPLLRTHAEIIVLGETLVKSGFFKNLLLVIKEEWGA